MHTYIPLRAFLVAGIAMTASLGPLGDEAREEPRKIGLEERVARKLSQLDVTVTGPAGAIENLTHEDFELVVGSRLIESFVVDNLCRPRAAPPEPEVEPDPPPVEETPPPPSIAPTTYIFYFDQPFLSMGGRVQALDTARGLIPRLIRSGSRASIVSSGQKLETFAGMTEDHAELLAAVDRVEHDRDQWDPTSASEEDRIREVAEAVSRDLTSALTLASGYQVEERWKAERALRRMSIVLGRLAEVDPPKAMVYFADRIRSRPGMHYTKFFPASDRTKRMIWDAETALHTFDRTVAEANAQGVRLYTVQAEGMASYPEQHIRQAENTLSSIAVETGGRAFLHGTAPPRIADEIEADLDCLYLISFDAEGLPEDRGLGVQLRVRPSGVKARVRGQTVVQSESARTVSRLLAGFADPDARQSGGGIRAVVIPTGFDDGTYSALVQVAVDGSPLPDATWDVGASLVAREKVREDFSGRIEVKAAGTPVVLEKEVSFRPGPYELVLVGHETRADYIVTGQLDGAWPDPGDAPATIGPIAVLQPVPAAFLRDGELRLGSGLGVSRVQVDRPVALITLVCRGKSRKKKLKIHRRLVGDSTVGFEPLELGPKDDRCVQIRDMIPPNTMTDGGFRYEVEVFDAEEAAASATHAFTAGGAPSG